MIEIRYKHRSCSDDQQQDHLVALEKGYTRDSVIDGVANSTEICYQSRVASMSMFPSREYVRISIHVERGVLSDRASSDAAPK
jgi:hypothetical protein